MKVSWTVCLILLSLKEALNPIDKLGNPALGFFDCFLTSLAVGPVLGLIHQIASRVLNVVDRVGNIGNVGLA